MASSRTCSEPNPIRKVPKYPSNDNTKRRRSIADRITLSSNTNVLCELSSASGNIWMLNSKAPIITISSEFDIVEDAQLVEVSDESKESENDFDFQMPLTKRGSTTRSKSESRRSQDQKKYDRCRKFKTLWAAKLLWVEGIMFSDGILHMVKCKVCIVVDRKLCIRTPKCDTFQTQWKKDCQERSPKVQDEGRPKVHCHFLQALEEHKIVRS